MSHSEPARIAARRIRSAILAALVFVSATIIGVVAARPATRGEADGAVLRGLRVFDEESPAVTKLDPDLLRALRQAARDAAIYRVEIVVNSGWRSPEYQGLLFRQAARKRKLRDGWPPRTRLLMCRDMRSTSGHPAPRRGCANTAPSTGYARSIGTNPGTTNCAPKPSMTGAHPCMPTPDTIQGCISDQPNVQQFPLFIKSHQHQCEWTHSSIVCT
jgi:hypothetical protein